VAGQPAQSASPGQARPAQRAAGGQPEGEQPAGVADRAQPAALGAGVDQAEGRAPVDALGRRPPVRVGLIAPMSGRGGDGVDGFKLYLETVRDSIADRTIEPVVADSQGTRAGALAAAAALAGRGHVSLLIALGGASECSAAASFAAERDAPPLAIAGQCPIQKLDRASAMARFASAPSGEVDTAADWAAKNGFRRAALLTTDSRPGLEASDAFASAFIARGGQIVQELHPPVGVVPELNQLNPAADLLALDLAEPDGARFAAAGKPRAKVLDLSGQARTWGEPGLGVVSLSDYLERFDAPLNRAFVRAWAGKYPGRAVSDASAAGYAAGQLLAEALTSVDGQAEDAGVLLQGLYHADTPTVKGRLWLDESHAAVHSTYLTQLIAQGSCCVSQLLQTYTNVGQDWDRTPDQLASFDFGGHKGTWVGVTSAQLGGAVARRSLYQFFGSSDIR
jgi:branched-chain amino acid transport system substrate-binding protein